MKIRRGEPGCVVKPAAQNRLAPERRRLARENNEHRLRDLLCVLGVLGLPEGDRMNQPDVPAHDLGKRLLGIIPGELLEEVRIWRVYHSTMILCAEPEMETDYFAREWTVAPPGFCGEANQRDREVGGFRRV